MPRKLVVPAMAVCAALAVSAPAASAAKAHTAAKAHSANLGPKITDIYGKLAGIGKVLGILARNDRNDDARVDTVVTQLAGINATLSAVVAAGLKIQAALEDTTTGLVGLNLARPKFAIVATTAAPAGATVAGATPGFVGVTRYGAGVYILDFGQDVSKRAAQLSINTPGLASAYAADFGGQILNCGASASATTVCDNVMGGAGRSNSHMALVNVEVVASSGGNTFAGTDGATFTATEIAG